ncbi:hypothetical protein FHR72_001112 [Mycolicibacterium iranicum]|uniref:Uncharacterized protein n=1 Tax=Mycolicibacterium iranicum TaxID=912594 RepID=A0A839Q1G4_MYCIR|nr:hypothetical protein [Mycolicibacterium iranicum]
MPLDRCVNGMQISHRLPPRDCNPASGRRISNFIAIRKLPVKLHDPEANSGIRLSVGR